MKFKINLAIRPTSTSHVTKPTVAKRTGILHKVITQGMVDGAQMLAITLAHYFTLLILDIKVLIGRIMRAWDIGDAVSGHCTLRKSEKADE